VASESSSTKVYVCCKCEPDANLDNTAPALTHLFCHQHGHCLHREMVRHSDVALEPETRRRPQGRADHSTGNVVSPAEGPPFIEHLRIHRLLQAEYASAMARMDSASEQFQATMREVPSGLPHPDGIQRIHNVSRLLSAARQELKEARTRLDNFAVHGIVPDDLKKSG
jgi:hypothetical protein